MSAKKKYRNTNEYLKYLKGELSRQERHAFERDLQADPFELEAMEGMEQVPGAELEEDLLSLHAALRKRMQRRRRRTLYYVAASVASLLLVGTVFLNIYDINPKSATESIPRDESFLHEDVAVPEESGARTKDPVEEDPGDMEELVIQDEEVQEAAEPLAYAAEFEAEVAEPEADAAEFEADAPEPEADAPVQKAMAPVEKAVVQVEEDMAPVEEGMAPVQKADELVVMEAKPQRSQKKGRAQEAPAPTSLGRVSGIVVSSEDMEPLPGASIMLKGSDSGQVADMDGRFSLVTDKQEQTTVIASYIGMETEEYELAEGQENQLVMEPDMAALDEVIVIGYDADKSAYSTGAVQTVNMDKEENKYSGARPEGGLDAYKMYIEEHLRFPAGNSTAKREVVVLKFKVNADGSISQIMTLRSPGDSFTEEAIRLLNEGPSWKPASDESGPTEDVVRMRIVFKK